MILKINVKNRNLNALTYECTQAKICLLPSSTPTTSQDGEGGGRPENHRFHRGVVLAAAIAMGLSSFLLILSVVVVFIVLFPSEYNWILEHIHVIIEIVLVT